ncbi:MAG TPA: hypothetical protein VKB57_22995 [Acidimicrobiales bacterium]|nr:hypothetical protein [Acidimicrobiales bacterium]
MTATHGPLAPAATDPLAAAAIGVLRGNDRGEWTRPSPRLYPHQWSWDAAVVAVGWAHLDPARAVTELRSLLRGQWAGGMIPHIVFDDCVAFGAYEPRPRTWATAGLSPAGVATSGICQPPLHAVALARVRATAAARGGATAAGVDAAVVELYPGLAAWHRWLHRARDPRGTGLVTILHPWESGLDNSPRWDAALAAVAVDAAATGERRPDLDHVADPAERPSEGDYRRYHTLVRALVEAGYDQDRALRAHPFRMVDVLFTAILAAADDALADLSVVAGRPGAAAGHRADAERGRRGLESCWDPDRAACLDRDLVAGGRPVAADTIAGFAPLVAGCDADRAAALAARLAGPSWAGAPGLRWPVPPTVAVDDPAFDPRSYWRGPSWPVVTWLLWWSLGRAGLGREAEALRSAALAQLRDTGCCEYVDPVAGEPLGSPAQSWTAAVALDWLAHQPQP